MYLKSETSKELSVEQTEHVRTARYNRLITSHQLFSSERALWVFVLRDSLYSFNISLFSHPNHLDSKKINQAEVDSFQLLELRGEALLKKHLDKTKGMFSMLMGKLSPYQSISSWHETEVADGFKNKKNCRAGLYLVQQELNGLLGEITFIKD